MNLYVLRYGSERGRGDYVGVGTPSRQVDAAKWIGRRAAVRARDESRKRGYDVRIVRLRPKRMLIGYVVRLDGPGEAPRWAGSCTMSWHPINTYDMDTTDATCRLVLPLDSGKYVSARTLADSWRERGYHNARVVPVYLRVRP